MSWQKATWRKGNKTVTGQWSYNWAADLFNISLDEIEPISGNRIAFTVCGDHPEFNGFKIREPAKMTKPIKGR